MAITNRLRKNIFYFLIFICAFALGIKSFSEPDLWWQIRTGEWILENHSIPHTDMFSYTMSGTEWINIKWGFEILAATVSSWSGPEAVYLLQAVVSVFLFLFLIKLSKLFSKEDDAENPAWLLSTTVSFLVTAFIIEYRINGRPEMFSHLFTVVFLFLLCRHRAAPSNKIFLLIPLQLIWVNMHEAYATGIVLISLFLFGAFVERRLKTKATQSSASPVWKLGITWIACIGVLTVNPYGMKLFLRPVDIFNQVQENKYTTELLSASDPRYWTFQTWLVLFMLLVSITGMLFALVQNKKISAKDFIQHPGIGYSLVFFAFFYLALTAYRNIIFLVFVLFPPFTYTLLRLFRYLVKENKLGATSCYSLSLLLPLIFYILIVSNNYYEITKSTQRFGLEVTSYNNPVGAAAYVEKKGLKNKNCFSDYLTSSYLLWKLQPGFRTYIDLRDLDIFPPSHFQQFIEATYSPLKFLSLDSLYHFDYVILFRPEFRNLHTYLYNDSLYACTYVDAVAAVYEKTDDFTRDDIFTNCSRVKPSSFSSLVNKLLNPFYVPFNYRSIDNNRIAAEYYSHVMQPALAAARQERYLSKIKR